MVLTWYRHFKRNGGLNLGITARQTSRFHCGINVQVVVNIRFSVFHLLNKTKENFFFEKGNAYGPEHLILLLFCKGCRGVQAFLRFLCLLLVCLVSLDYVFFISRSDIVHWTYVEDPLKSFLLSSGSVHKHGFHMQFLFLISDKVFFL